MSLNKKAELSRDTILIIIISLAFLVVIGIFIWQSKGVLYNYFNQILG